MMKMKNVGQSSRWSWRLLASIGTALVAGCGPEGEVPAGQAPLGEATQEIVGGTNATISEFPWQISFQTNTGSHFCGGSILNANWILTAAHCVDESALHVVSHPSTVRIGAGSANRTTPAQVRQIADIIHAPGYVDASQGKDVALLRLATPLTLNTTSVKAIPLATSADVSAGYTDPGVMATVTGWGATSSGSSTLPTTLQKVDVPIVSHAEADAAYPESITPDQLAAGYMGVGGKDSCQGDSGGPLVVNGSSGKILAGVVSWGYGCADPNYPGMYARVSSFGTWISSFLSKAPTARLSQTSLSSGASTWKHFTISVPTGTTALTVNMTGSSGDADLYVHTATPTSTAYTCRPYANGSNEYCSIPNPQAGTWYISIRGYTAYSGAALKANTY